MFGCHVFGPKNPSATTVKIITCPIISIDGPDKNGKCLLHVVQCPIVVHELGHFRIGASAPSSLFISASTESWVHNNLTVGVKDGMANWSIARSVVLEFRLYI
jgi:hypothetical protein